MRPLVVPYMVLPHRRAAQIFGPVTLRGEGVTDRSRCCTLGDPDPVVTCEQCGISVQRIPATTASEISDLARCRAVFTPGHPARTGTVAFCRTDGAAPPSIATGSVETLAVALPDGDGVALVEVTGVVVPVREALPALTRARADAHTHPAVAFWGAAAVLAFQFVARGLLPPGLSPSDHGAWRVGPLSTEDVDHVRRLAAAMPPEAHAVPLDAGFRCGCPSPSGCCAVSSTRWPPRCPAPPRRRS